jgi:DhnA family fructose-bisphosphate aldolase class Ia
MTEAGRVNRLRRIGPRPIHLLALDHGVSMGWTDAQDPPSEIASACAGAGLSGVVCHHGAVEAMHVAGFDAVVLQMMGGMEPGGPKAVIASIETALEMDCVGVSLELPGSASPEALSTMSLLASSARRAGLVVLVMISTSPGDIDGAARAIVGANQLGADLVKVSVEGWASEKARLESTARVIRGSVPVLAAGGSGSSDLRDLLRTARDLGMSGTCVGRHYFEGAERALTLTETIGGSW